MSGSRSDNSNVPVPQASVSSKQVAPAAVDGRMRWAALDSRHERLVTASDSMLADLGRKDAAKALLAS